MRAAELRAALRCERDGCPCSRGRNVHCPAHDDSHPSLTVDERNAVVLFNCKKGCPQQAVHEALVKLELWGREEREPIPLAPRRERLTSEHEYCDATGALLAVHGRFEGPGGKTFRWRLPKGDWRDGLGGMPETALPLYRLQDVLSRPEEPVFLVEGEKAADACAEQGLVAVSLPGGASQQRFGNALDALAGREVVLWPDNDEAGRGLMQRVAGALPDAGFVSPPLAPRGDAADYFAAGGTLEGLAELRRSAEPRVSVEGPDAVRVEIPVAAGHIRFGFTGLAASARAVDSMTEVAVDVPGLRRRTPYSVRLNLESASGVDQVRRTLERIYPSKELNWAVLLSEAADSAKTAWRSVDLSVDLADVPVPGEHAYLVDRFMPEKLVTILFGMGGVGKSLLALDIALHCVRGEPWMGRRTKPVEGVLIIDYEDIEDEWRLRIDQLSQANGWEEQVRGVRFVPGRAIPLADQLAQLRRLVAEYRVGLVVIDSAASACGGELLDVQPAARLINALNALGVTSLLIAHNTKANDSNYPYGNIFWHNLARSTHYVEQQQEEGALTATVGIYNRKSNRGKQQPIGVELVFPESDTGPVRIASSEQAVRELAKAAESASGRRWEVADLLDRKGALTVGQIAQETGIDERAIRKLLDAADGDLFVCVDETRPQRWGYLEKHAKAEPSW